MDMHASLSSSYAVDLNVSAATSVLGAGEQGVRGGLAPRKLVSGPGPRLAPLGRAGGRKLERPRKGRPHSSPLLCCPRPTFPVSENTKLTQKDRLAF